MGLPANLHNLSLEQQQDLWLRAWEHFRLKVQIIELFKAWFPKENWIPSESVRKTNIVIFNTPFILDSYSSTNNLYVY